MAGSRLAKHEQEVCAVGRPFGRFGKPSGRSSFFVPMIRELALHTSELAFRQVLLLCHQDKRTGSPHKRTGSPAGPPSLAPGEANWLSGRSSVFEANWLSAQVNWLSGRSSFCGPRISELPLHTSELALRQILLLCVPGISELALHTSELALRQVLLLCPQDKRTGSGP